MDQVTQKTAATAEESAATATELNAQVAALKKSADELVGLVNRNRSLSGKANTKSRLNRPEPLPAKNKPESKTSHFEAPQPPSNGKNHRVRMDLSVKRKAAAADDPLPMGDDFKDF